MEIQTIHYTPEWHDRLLAYMQMVYPHRNLEYLNWWVTNINDAGPDCWNKCLLIQENDNHFIGCTTANKTSIVYQHSIEPFYFRGNTIISPNQRGKGISKEIYNRVNSYNNWLSLGITEIAWKIQPKYVINFTPLRPINVYIGVNRRIVIQLLKKLFRVSNSSLSDVSFPLQLKINGHDEIRRIKHVSEMIIPINGHWMEDNIEFVRDEEFINKRFFEIYCAERYGVYQYISKSVNIGYVILRKTIYKGFEMISLVDYRFHARKDELRAFKVASKMARLNHIGMVIALSSRDYGNRLTPLLIKMKKTLNCATGCKDYADKFNDALFTSADSDLDFVYYM